MRRSFGVTGEKCMKFLIFSDSHGHTSAMERALVRHRDADAVFFLGDGISDAEEISLRGDCPPVFRVLGNCDSSLSPYGMERRMYETYTLPGHRILLLHGHTAGARCGLSGLVVAAKEAGADIVLYGHTHIPAKTRIPEEEGGPLCLFNPGSIGAPSDGIPRYGLLTIQGDNILFSHGKEELYG